MIIIFQFEAYSFQGKIAMLLFEICFVQAFIIGIDCDITVTYFNLMNEYLDITYWSILVPGYYLVTHTLPLINFWTFNHHGGNLVFLLIEFAFNRIPMYSNFLIKFLL